MYTIQNTKQYTKQHNVSNPQGVYKALHIVLKLISVGKKVRFPNIPGTNNNSQAFFIFCYQDDKFMFSCHSKYRFNNITIKKKSQMFIYSRHIKNPFDFRFHF